MTACLSAPSIAAEVDRSTLPDWFGPDLQAAYVRLKILPDGRICGVHRLAYHWTLHVDIGPVAVEDRYCFAERWMAEAALLLWDGIGDPVPLWHRHPGSGRRRDRATGREWVAF